MKAIALISGGLDSLVALATALKDCDRVIALHAHYRQFTEEREKEAALDIIRHYNLKAFFVTLDHLKVFGGTVLTAETPEEIPEGVPEKGVVPSTYVPFRNGNLLSIAVSLAEAQGAER